MNGWVSPLLGIRFELIGNDLQLYYPNGDPFETYPELMAQLEQERLRRRELTEQLSSLDPEQLQALGIDPDLLQ